MLYVVHITMSVFFLLSRLMCVFLLYVYTECVAGRFGADCQQRCECENSGQCDRQTGRCSCSGGWVGERCEKGEPVSKTNKPTEAVTSQEALQRGNCRTGNIVYFC